MLRLSLLPTLSIFVILSSQAAMLTVPGNYATIQAAINAATDGDEIVVAPGTYTQTLNLGHKNIILRSTNPLDPDVVGGTILDRNQRPMITLGGSTPLGCELAGFTVRRGTIALDGSVNLHHNVIRDVVFPSVIGQPTYLVTGGGGWIHDNVIENNQVVTTPFMTLAGGISSFSGLVESNVLRNNLLNSGLITGASGTVRGNVIINNAGNALHFCGGIIENNRILHNTGVGMRGSSSIFTVVRNNVMAYNVPPVTANMNFQGRSVSIFFEIDNLPAEFQNNTLEGAVYTGYGNQPLVFKNNIIWGYDPALVPTFGRPKQLVNCLVVNSTDAGSFRFVAPDQDDFQLQADSPAIDAGAAIAGLNRDIDGHPRPTGAGFDIGAYEYVTPVPPSDPPRWFAPRVVAVPANTGPYPDLVRLADHISDDLTAPQDMQYSLVSQTRPDVAVVDVSPAGVLSLTVQPNKVGVSRVVVRARDESQAEADLAIEVIVVGPTTVSRQGWESLR